MPKEIERRFLPDETPEVAGAQPLEIEQVYLAADAAREVRLRSKGGTYLQTVKIGAGEIREELEVAITEEVYHALRPAAIGRPVRKERTQLPDDAELNVFRDQLEGLVTIEREFADRVVADAFVPPASFGVEVTEDTRFESKHLAQLPGADLTVRGHLLHLMADARRRDPAVLGLDAGIAETVARASTLVAELGRPVVVLVAGGSASGKTSRVAEEVARALALAGNSAQILSQDHYYRGGAFMEAARAEGHDYNFDQPEVLELELLAEHIMQLRAGGAIEQPVYSFANGGTRVGTRSVTPTDAIIVEGLFTLDPAVVATGDLRVFVEVDRHGAIFRRIMRDPARTGQTALEILRQMQETVLPMHDKYVEPTRRVADLVVSNPYRADVEAVRTGASTCQLKFPGLISRDALAKLKARRLATVDQEDTLLWHQSLLETGEIARIRREGLEGLFEYKGPPVEGDRTTRFHLPPFELDPLAERRLREESGQDVRIVQKRRSFWLLPGGVVLHQDTNVRIRDGEEGEGIPLGDFTEIHVPEGTQVDDILLARLGFSRDEALASSYAEM